MKKAIFIIAALVVFTSFTFAQASVGAWGRAIWIPVGGGSGDDDKMVMQNHASWGWNPRVGMTISGSSDNVGFQADFNVDAGNGGTVGVGDNAKIWVKPIDMLTIQAGVFFDDTLRGNAVFGAWDWLRYSFINGEDAIFERVGINEPDGHGANIEIALAPMEGVYLFWATNQIHGALYNEEEIMAALSHTQFGAGYTIEGIGQIRAQYVGEQKYTSADSGYINAAFKLTMVEGLLIDVGMKYWMESGEQTGNVLSAALYASYTMDALTIHAYGDMLMVDEDYTGYDDLAFGLAIGVDYNLEGGIGINADFRYDNEAKTGFLLPDGAISAMFGVKLGFSNGLIGAGIEITTGNFVGTGDAASNWTGFMITKTGEVDDMVFAIPVRLEYWF
jgi:hypothetical protein